jgi:integrase
MLDELQKMARERGEEPPATLREFRLHDLRRSAATNMARLGADRVTIAKVLNHSESGELTATYDRFGRDAEKRRALELWAQRLQTIVEGSELGNVVHLAGRG